MLVWFKGDAGVEATAGVPATLGGTVGVWKDQSGNGFDATVLDPTKLPTYAANDNLGNAPVVRWPVPNPEDPTDTRGMGFGVPGASLAVGQESTYFVFFESANDEFNRRFIDFTGAGAFRNYSKGYTPPADPTVVGPFDGTRAYHGSLVVNDAPHIGTLTSRQGNLEHFVDGERDTLTLFYPNNATEGWDLKAVDNLRIGIQGTTNPYVGDIAELIIYSRAFSDTERNDLVDYFIDKYEITPPAAPGDFNNDTFINELDFDIMRMNFLQPGGKSQGDMDADGFVGLPDWLLFRPLATAAGINLGSIPEPGGVALLLLGSALLCGARRHGPHRFAV